MGKQVNFYMAGSDEADFVEFVRSERNTGIFIDGMGSTSIPLLTQLPERGTPFWFSVWLWDQVSSPAPSLRYVPEQKYFVVDRFSSEVIEFTRSYADGDCLVRGRLWAEMTVMQKDGTTIAKSKSFEKWYDRLANWIKRRSSRDDRGDYVMPGAEEYVTKGGKLVQAVFANTTKHFRHETNEPD